MWDDPRHPGVSTLAQTPPAIEVVLWLGVIVAVAVVLGVALLALRKRLKSTPSDLSFGMGFTREELDRLRDAGQITDDQHAAILEKLRAQARAELGVGSADGPSPDNLAAPGGSAPTRDEGPPTA